MDPVPGRSGLNSISIRTDLLPNANRTLTLGFSSCPLYPPAVVLTFAHQRECSSMNVEEPFPRRFEPEERVCLRM